MSDESTTETVQPTDPAGTTDDTGTTTTAPETGDGKDMQAEVEKWKALARQNEQRAKANSTAASELDKLRKAAMSDQEKAVAEAEQRGRSAAAQEYGRQLAQARFEAAAAAKGVDLGEAADLIDVSRFLGEDGSVDDAAIKSAVSKLAKVTPAKATGPARSGGEFGGAPGGAGQITEDQLAAMSPADVAKAYNDGRLKHLM